MVGAISVDIAKYNSDGYKRMLGDLAKYSEYVQSYNETKVVEGNKVPKRVYQVVILEPEAVDLNVIKQAKAAAVQNHIERGEKSTETITKEVEQIKKIEGDVKETNLPPYEITKKLGTKVQGESK